MNENEKKDLIKKSKKAIKAVAKYAKEKQTFTFQAAANHFDCDTAYGVPTKEKRLLLQLALFAMIEKNQLSYNPETGHYRYIGA